jgi:two-component system cell cycle response regulator
MALRVLLADESSTIKKVIQLSLHDFGVEVKSVSNGLDVISVLENFKPDIVFVDVLLSKKTGYDVCAEIKHHRLYGNIPVVLMWSGFMSLDESKTIQAKPDSRLEKPFDSEQIRNMVSGLVPRANSNPIKDFLDFPKMPDFSEDAEKIKKLIDEKNHIFQQSTPKSTSSFERQAPQRQPVPPPPNEDSVLTRMDEEWAQQPVKRSDPSHKKTEFNDFGIKDLSQVKIKITDDFEEISFDDQSQNLSPNQDFHKDQNHHEDSFQSHNLKQNEPSRGTTSTLTNATLPSHEQMEEMIRDQVQKIATEVCLKMCQKILPDIAEKLVQQEIQRILLENPQK